MEVGIEEAVTVRLGGMDVRLDEYLVAAAKWDIRSTRLAWANAGVVGAKLRTKILRQLSSDALHVVHNVAQVALEGYLGQRRARPEVVNAVG